MNGTNDQMSGSRRSSAPHPSTEPTLSTAETLSGIFHQPTETFESLRSRPRFLIATIIVLAVLATYSILFIQWVGYETIIRARIASSPQLANLDTEQIEQIVQSQNSPVSKAIAYSTGGIITIIMLFIGAGLYWLGVAAMAKAISFKQAAAVWIYSSLPPVILQHIANVVMLFLKDKEDVALEKAGRVAHANLSILVDSTAHPVLAVIVGSLDLFVFYGLFLAALGIATVARVSRGSAWGIVLAVWLLGIILRLMVATILGIPIA